MKKIKVLVADDHEIVRYGICSVISTADDIEVVAEAANGQEAIERYREQDPDVCILDIGMPFLNGIEAAREILSFDSHANIIILTMHVNEEYLNKALNVGALGYLLKNSSKKELLEAIRKVAKGEKIFSEPISKMMAEKYIRQARRNEREKESVNITNREKEILRLIVDGYTSHEIAQILHISPRTVDTHRANLMQKLDIKNTAALVRYAIEHGHVEDQ